MCALVLISVTQHTKFQVREFTNYKDMIGSQNLKWITWAWPRPF